MKKQAIFLYIQLMFFLLIFSDSGVEEHNLETHAHSERSSDQDSIEANIHSPGSPTSLDSATDFKSVSLT
jgi:hypothetical protein